MSSNNNRLYVGNLPYRFSDGDVRELFSPYGEIEEVKVICDFNTGRSKGFAFVTFANNEDAEKAMELHEQEVDGRHLKVSQAHERERGGGGGGGGGGRPGGGRSGGRGNGGPGSRSRY